MKIAQPLFMVSAVLLVLAGCTQQPDNALQAGIGQEFTLSTGQKARIAAEGLEIAFLNVTEDSRCPRQVVCVWEGQAKTAFAIEKGGAVEQLELIDRGGMEALASKTALGYSITLKDISPYPEKGREITGKDYKATLLILRSG